MDVKIRVPGDMYEVDAGHLFPVWLQWVNDDDDDTLHIKVEWYQKCTGDWRRHSLIGEEYGSFKKILSQWNFR